MRSEWSLEGGVGEAFKKEKCDDPVDIGQHRQRIAAKEEPEVKSKLLLHAKLIVGPLGPAERLKSVPCR